MEQAAEVMYLCPNAPTVRVKLKSGKYRAENGVLRLSVENAAELDALIKIRPDLRALLKKVNLEEAERQVADHRAKQSAAAVQGPFSSSNQSAAVLRRVNRGQKAEVLTGSQNPVNKAAEPARGPLKVTEVPL